MSAPTLTFSPTMFHAAVVAKTKTVTRRHIEGLDPKAIDKFVMSAAHQRIVAVLHSGMVVDFGKPAHHPGEIKPAVTSWRVNGSIDHLKPTELDPDTVMETGGIHWEHVGGIDDKGRWNTNRFSHEGKLRPARFFPSKLYHLAPQFRILDARPEWLHDITAADALLEGLTQITKDNAHTWKYGLADRDGLPGNDNFGWFWDEWCTDAREAYFKLWDTLHGPGHAATNPLVWRYEFEPVVS